MADRRPRFGDLTRNQRSLFLAQLVESIGNFGLVTAFTLWATGAGTTPARIAQLVSWVILANTVPASRWRRWCHGCAVVWRNPPC